MFWFNLKKKAMKLEIEYEKKKALLEIEYQKGKAELENTHLTNIAKRTKDYADLVKLANTQINEFEHEYHSGMEKRKVELAKLDGEIEAKKALLQAKDAELIRANAIIEKLANALSNNNRPVEVNNNNSN